MKQPEIDQQAPVMAEFDLRKVMAKEKMSDSWHTCVDGVISETPVPLSKTFEFGSAEERFILILHSSQLKAADPAWIRLNRLSKLKNVSKKDIQKKMLAKQIATIVLLVIVAGAAYLIYKDSKKPAEVVHEPTVSEIIDKAIHEGQFEASAATELPELPTILSYTKFQFYVVNAGEKDWPGFKLWLNHHDGEPNYIREDALKAGITLTISKRDLNLDSEDGEIKHVYLEVDGYQPVEKTF